MAAPSSRSWRRILPIGFVLVSLFALVLLPIVVRQRTNRIRMEMRGAVEPARIASQVLARAVAEQRALVVSYQATEQGHFIASYRRAVETQQQAHRMINTHLPELGPVFREKYDQLLIAEKAWGAAVVEAELIERPLPAPVFMERLFRVQPRIEDLERAHAELERALELESRDRQAQIDAAESVNATISFALTVLALIAALMVAWIGRQLRLLATAAQTGRDEAARETARATEAKRAAEDAHGRAAFLSEASRELSLSMEMQQLLDRVAAMSVPLLGDYCFIDTAENGGRLRRTAFAHRNRSKQRFLEELPEEPQYATLPEFAAALQSDRPVVVSDLSGDLRSAIAGHDQHLMEVLDPRSVLIAPLSARGRTLGAVTFVHAESRRTFETDDVVLAWELSRRIAVAADNARLYEEMQQALRSREEILAIVSHDLRSPLTTISMTASVLQEMPPDAEDLIEHMEVIRTSAKRMTRLINDLLDVTRMDAGHQLPIETSELELSPVVDELMHIFAPQAEARGLTLQVRSELDGTRINADRDRLVQAISNLLGNALKFTPEGGVIVLSLKREQESVHVAVHDSGAGIPEENLHRIWDPYWQMKRNARMGAGLGLAIVKGIVEAHGGRVWVESEVGKGTTFHLMVPTAPAIVQATAE